MVARRCADYRIMDDAAFRDQTSVGCGAVRRCVLRAYRLTSRQAEAIAACDAGSDLKAGATVMRLCAQGAERALRAGP